MIAQKKTLFLLAILTTVCACAGQEPGEGLLPPMPGNAIELGAQFSIESENQQTGDITIEYYLNLTNVSDETLEKVILQDFQLPGDLTMSQGRFVLENVKPGEVRQIIFKVIVKGWGLNPKDQEWSVDFTIRIERGSAYTEQTFYYGFSLNA